MVGLRSLGFELWGGAGVVVVVVVVVEVVVGDVTTVVLLGGLVVRVGKQMHRVLSMRSPAPQ